MDLEQYNLAMIKQQSRKIVERAYNKSQINKKYSFPKKKPQFDQDSQMSDIESLRSRVSEFYDLKRQNLKNNQNQINRRTIVPFDRLLKGKKEKKCIQKNKMQTKSTFFTSNKSQQLKTRSKRKYLSLTPAKSQNYPDQALKSARSIQKQVIGIHLTKKELSLQLDQGFKNVPVKSESRSVQSQVNVRNLAQSVIQGLERFTSRCFDRYLSKQLKQTQKKSQAIFDDNCKIEWSKQTFLKKSVKRDSNLEQVTRDSTPNAIDSNEPFCSKGLGSKEKNRNSSLKISPFQLF